MVENKDGSIISYKQLTDLLNKLSSTAYAYEEVLHFDEPLGLFRVIDG
jgi:hypothetical protein